MPKSEGLKKPFYFPITELFAAMGCCAKKSAIDFDEIMFGTPHPKPCPSTLTCLMDPPIDDHTVEEGMDEDVAKEKANVLGGKYSTKDAAVLLNGVTKTFVTRGIPLFTFTLTLALTLAFILTLTP